MSDPIDPDVLAGVIGVLEQLADDWEYDDEITPATRFVEDLGLESLEIVVLGTMIQQRYGKYLVRFRMAGGKGVAGILLLWPQAPHWPPEIDFAETGGEHTNRPDISATVHYPPGDQTIERTIKENFTKWHVVGVEWTPSRLVYTLDGRRWASVRSPHVPAEPMELDMQAQAGTCGVTYAPCPDASTPSHVDLDVDWVVAYGRTA